MVVLSHHRLPYKQIGAVSGQAKNWNDSRQRPPGTSLSDTAGAAVGWSFVEIDTTDGGFGFSRNTGRFIGVLEYLVEPFESAGTERKSMPAHCYSRMPDETRSL